MKATYVEIKCDKCNGDGFTAEHANHPHPDGDCLGECPVQVQCENCQATGIMGREIFKDPITDDGTKKSAKGLLQVEVSSKMAANSIPEYTLRQGVSWEEEEGGALQTIYKDGEFFNETTFDEVRKRLSKYVE